MFDYVQVRVRKSEAIAACIEVPAWEVPLLQAVHGQDACKVVGSKQVLRDKPDPASEYNRLEVRYKEDPSDGRSFVALVYGAGAIGLERLANAIREAPVAEGVAGVAGFASDDGEGDVDMTGLFEDPTVDDFSVQPLDQ